MRFRSNVVLVLALMVAGSSLYLWLRPRPGSEHAELAVPTPEPEATVPSPPAAPPQPGEVQPLLDRVFAATVVLDADSAPAFVAGDLNGDEVTDLAAAVRPRGPEALARLNDPLAPWSLQDALAPPEQGRPPGPAIVAAGDRLLAVVHGMSPGGWRHPDARQGYLVRNAVGAPMTLAPMAETPEPVRARAFRPHIGEAIATRRGREPGLVFWTGAAYAWGAMPSSPRGSAPR
jgi:hypothetical protein